MKRPTRTKISILMCVIVLVTLACQLTPQTPAQILEQAKQKMGELQTYHMDMTLTMSVTGATITITARGDAQMPDKAYMTMEMLGQEIEVLMLSSSEAYTRMSGQTEWTPVDPATLSQSTGIASAASQLQITDYATNIVKQQDETVEGVACYHLSMDVDAEEMMNVVNPGLSGQVSYGSEPARMDVWVGKQDSLIHKMSYDLAMVIEGQDTDMSMMLTFSNFDEAVDIPTP